MSKYIFYLVLSTIASQTTTDFTTVLVDTRAGTEAAIETVAQVQDVSKTVDTSWCTLKNATVQVVDYLKFAGDVNRTRTHCFSSEGKHLIQNAAQVCFDKKSRLPRPGDKARL